MFVAWRDLRFAKGRFVLIGSVVALITLLVGFLSGLTGGLAAQNISAVLSLPTDQLVFAAGSDADEASFSDSQLTSAQAEAWSAARGVVIASPVGITQTRAEAGDARTAVALFGVDPAFGIGAPSKNGVLGLSVAAADSLSVDVGDTVTIAGTDYAVEVVTGDWWYSHTPVVQMTIDDWPATNEAADTISHPPLMALTAIGAFRSEIGSQLLMVGMLFGISALVIGAFFTVWTMQRQGDIAILKALGASTPSLIRDALGQALVVLLVGVGVGIGMVAILGSLAGTSLPFILSPMTTLMPAAIMIALGLAGAAFALRSVTTADPLTALGSNR